MPPCPSVVSDQVSLWRSMFCDFASGSTYEDVQLRSDGSVFHCVHCALHSVCAPPLFKMFRSVCALRKFSGLVCVCNSPTVL